MPAEWEPHAATWLAWPHFRNDWPGKFEPIPWVYAEVIRNLAPHERVGMAERRTEQGVVVCPRVRGGEEACQLVDDALVLLRRRQRAAQRQRRQRQHERPTGAQDPQSA